MRRYLIALLALMIMTIVTPTVNARSPQQCKATLDVVLRQLKSKGGNFTSDHF